MCKTKNENMQKKNWGKTEIHREEHFKNVNILRERIGNISFTNQ